MGSRSSGTCNFPLYTARLLDDIGASSYTRVVGRGFKLDYTVPYTDARYKAIRDSHLCEGKITGGNRRTYQSQSGCIIRSDMLGNSGDLHLEWS